MSQVEILKKSDDHYQELEAAGQTEPIVIMEELHERLLIDGVPPNAAANIMLAQKHMTRAGAKKGEPWEKEIMKSINYLTRSVMGKWAE